MNRNGFTMAELIFVAALTVIILGALVALYTTNHQFYNMASIFTELRGETKNFKNQVTKDIEEAVGVATSHGSYTTTAGTSSSSGTLVLKCYSINSGNFETTSYDYIVYYIPTGTSNIHRVVDADSTYDDRGDSDRTLVENADNMYFEFYNTSQTKITSNYDNASRININLTVKKTWAGKSREESIHASVRLRNKR